MRTSIEDLIKKAGDSFPGKVFVGNSSDIKVQKIGSGILSLDNILGGGIPRGRSMIVSGEFSTGKSTLCAFIIAECQRKELFCVYIDAEKALDPEWFKLLGVDIDKLIVTKPNYGEEATAMALYFLKENADLIVLDSIAALVPLDEINEDMEQQHMGLQPRLVNKTLRKILAENNNSAFIAINQLRETIGKPGIYRVMPGGKGQYFFSSIILEVSRKEWITEGAEKKKVGFVMNCFTAKNKLAQPFQQTEIPFNFSTGQVDYTSVLFNLACDIGLINKVKTSYFYGERRLAVGKDASIEILKVDEVLQKELKKKINIG